MTSYALPGAILRTSSNKAASSGSQMFWKKFMNEGRRTNSSGNIRHLSVGEVLLQGQHPLMILLHRQTRVLGRLIRGLLNSPLQVMPLEMLLPLVLALL